MYVQNDNTSTLVVMQLTSYNNIYVQNLLPMMVGAERMMILPRNLVTATKLFLRNVNRNVSQIQIASHSLMKLQLLLIILTATVIPTDPIPLEAEGPTQNVTYWTEVGFSHCTSPYMTTSASKNS